MATTTFTVVLGGVSFFCYLILAMWELFVVTSLVDLRRDTISSKDLSEELNHLFIRFYIFHIFAASIQLANDKWIEFLFEVPLILLHCKQYFTNKIKMDWLQIKRNDELHKTLIFHLFHLVYYSFAFITGFIMFEFSF